MSRWPSTKARRVLAALLRIGWSVKRQSGSHRTLARAGWLDFVFAFHDDEEIGPRMLARFGSADLACGPKISDGMRGAVTTGLLLTAALWAGPPPAQVYRWVDAEGTIHYSTGVESVPEAYRDGARLLSGAREPAGPTRIAFTPGAPIRVSALIDGRGPVTLILDTGADGTMAAPAALARLGIATPGTLRARVSGVGRNVLARGERGGRGPPAAGPRRHGRQAHGVRDGARGRPGG